MMLATPQSPSTPSTPTPSTPKEESNSGVKVVCRFRPLNEVEKCDEDKIVYEVTSGGLMTGGITDKQKGQCYERFDTVLGPESSQEETYLATAQTLVDEVLEGYNAGVFAYGQSGGGKSFSLLGKEGMLLDHKAKGIIPRTIQEFFNKAQALSEQGEPVQVLVSFYELYLNEIYDLLLTEEDYRRDEVTEASYQAKKPLLGREDRHLEQLTEVPIRSAAQAIEMLSLGTMRRRYCAMPLNPVSSRSHGIFVLKAKRQCYDLTNVSSSLYFADLMGSEALVEGSDGKVEETASINNDLLVLGRLITSLSKGAAGNTRDSTLTYLLRDVLAGNAKATVLVTGSSHKMQYHATRNSLQFGDKCKGITRSVTLNKKRLTAAEMEVHVHSMRKEVVQKQQLLQDLEAVVDDVRHANTSLQDDLNAAKEKAENTRQANAEEKCELKSQISNVEFEKKILTKQVTKERDEKVAAIEERNLLQGSLEAAEQTKNDAICHIVEELDREKHEAMAVLEKEREKLKGEVDELNKQIEQKQKAKSMLNDMLKKETALREGVEAKLEEETSVKLDLTIVLKEEKRMKEELTLEGERRQRENESLGSQVFKLKAREEKQKAELSALQSELLNNQAEHEANAKQEKESRAQIDQLQGEKSDLQATLQSEKKAGAATEAKFVKLGQELSGVRKKLEIDMQKELNAKRSLEDRLKEDEKQRAVLKDELEQQVQLTSTLQSQLSEKQSRISDVSKDLSNAQREGDATRLKLLAERDKLQEDLVVEEARLKASLQEEQKEKRVLEGRIAELESRLMQEKSQHGVTGNKLLQQEEVGASLETQLGEARSKVSDLETNLAATKQESTRRIVELESTLEEEKGQHGAIRDKHQQQEQLGATLQSQLSEKHSRISDLESSLADTKKENGTLAADLRQEKEEHAAVDEELLDANVILEQQKVALESLESGLTGSQTSLKAKLDAERELLKANSRLEKEKKELKVKLDNEAKAAAAKLLSEQENAAEDLARFRKEFEEMGVSLQKELSEKHAEVASLQREGELRSAELERSNAARAGVNRELSEAREMSQGQRTELTALRKGLAKGEGEIRDQAARLGKLESENGSLIAQIAADKASMTEEAVKQSEMNQAALAAEKTFSSALEARLSREHDMVQNKLETELKGLHCANHELEEHAQSLTEDASRLTRKHQDLEAEIDATSTEKEEQVASLEHQLRLQEIHHAEEWEKVVAENKEFGGRMSQHRADRAEWQTAQSQLQAETKTAKEAQANAERELAESQRKLQLLKVKLEAPEARLKAPERPSQDLIAQAIEAGWKPPAQGHDEETAKESFQSTLDSPDWSPSPRSDHSRGTSSRRSRDLSESMSPAMPAPPGRDKLKQETEDKACQACAIS